MLLTCKTALLYFAGMDASIAVSRACAHVGGKGELARRIGVSPSFVSQLASKGRPIPAERCVAIEGATNGVVMRWDLRPTDWHRLWPELRARPDAPAVAERVAAEAGAA